MISMDYFVLNYLKLRGVTIVGLLLYPILAPLFLAYVGVYALFYWVSNAKE